MKTLFKVSLMAVCFGLQGYAQQVHERTMSEEFSTNKDVEIKVDTRYTDIIIEPWSKNSVRVEATIKVEGVSDERAMKTLENWNFKALGNKSQVEVTTREGNVLFSYNVAKAQSPVVMGKSINLVNGYPNLVNGFLFDNDSLRMGNHVVINGVPISTQRNNLMVGSHNGNIVYLDSLQSYNFNYNYPNVDHLNELLAKIPEFDYKKFEADQGYIFKWQEEMKKSMAKLNESRKNGSAESAELAKEMAELRKSLQEKQDANQSKQLEKLNEVLEMQHQRQAELAQKQAEKSYKLALQKMEQKNKLKSVEIKNLLAEREKIKVTRTIVIRAPKNAKFKLDAKYGTVSFSK